MTSRTLGGLLLIVAAVLLAVLWTRGYLSGWIAQAIALFGTAPAKRPFTPPGGSSLNLPHHQ